MAAPTVGPVLSPGAAIAVAGALLAAFAILALGDMWLNVPTADEPIHIVAGYSDVRWGDRRINPEHPPLVKKLAALAMMPSDPWPKALHGAAAAGSERAGGPGFVEFRDAFDSFWSEPDAALRLAHDFLYAFRAGTFERAGVRDSRLIPPSEAYSKADFLNDAGHLLFVARLPVLCLGILLGCVIFAWSYEMWGPAAAVLSLALFCFDPNFIAHSGLVTTDVPVAAFMTAAVYFLWRTLRRLTIPDALATAAFFSLALVSKYSAVLLIPVMFWLGFRRVSSRDPWPRAFGGGELTSRKEKSVAVAALVGLTMILSFGAVWAAYGFRYSAAADPGEAAANFTEVLARTNRSARIPRFGYFPLRPVLERDAALESLLGAGTAYPSAQEVDAATGGMPLGVSRSALLWLSESHVLPEAFVYGISLANMGSHARAAFLRGSISDTGFPSYFLWTTLLKTPLPTLLVAALAVFAIARGTRRTGAGWFLLFPAGLVFVAALSSRLNIGHRHVITVWPFLFVAAGAALPVLIGVRSRWRKAFAWLIAALVVAEAFVVFAPPWRPAPLWAHHLEYFNELAGGPREGYKSLVDSNVDWGQDLAALKEWMVASGVRGPINLSYFGSGDPRYYGIRHHNFFLGYEGEKDEMFDGVYPGILAISVTNLQGVRYDPTARATWGRFFAQSGAKPIGMVGYSIMLYRVERPPRG